MARNTAKATLVSPHLRVLAPLLTAALACSSSVAEEWDFSANVFTSVTYTDNVILVAENGDDEFIWEIGPSIMASRDGKRVDVNFDYRLQGLLYAREDRRNEVYNYLQSNLSAIVVPDWIQFDADASISQTVINPLLASGKSSISTSGNSAETLTINASPYIVHSLGPATQFRAGVAAGIVDYDDPSLVDNKQRDYFASLANSGGSGALNWSFGYTSKLVEYDLGQEIELARATGEIGFRISPRTEFVVSGGEDINDFGSLPGSRVAEGGFWNAGFRGGFGDNVQFDVRVGEQFFGESYGVDFTRTARSLTTSIGYEEAATTIGAQQLDFSNARSLLGLTGLDDQFDINGFELPQRDPELYIRRRFNFNNTLNTGRSRWNLGIYYEDRSFIRTASAGDRENVQGARLDWTWDYDNVTVISTGANYQRLDSRDTVSKPQDFRFNVQVRRELFSNSYVSAMYYRNSRNAPLATDEYQENALRIGFGRRF